MPYINAYQTSMQDMSMHHPSGTMTVVAKIMFLKQVF